jgi:hypothetical protein
VRGLNPSCGALVLSGGFEAVKGAVVVAGGLVAWVIGGVIVLVGGIVTGAA